ncbi:MAG: archaeosine biosynthesis radical SAM protein RaSEA [Halobacteria archaeon]
MGMDTSGDPTVPIAVWKGRELLKPGEPADSLTIILRTVGCSWGRCLMCGFFNMTSPGLVASDALITQYESAMSECPEGAVIKLYTSGSFYDAKEVPPEAQEEILKRLAGDPRPRKVIIETMPEYITPEIFRLPVPPGLEFAIGLESSSDYVRDRCVVKGFTWEGFKRACGVARDHGATVKAYTILKPPFLTEADAIEDAVKTCRDAFSVPNVTTVSMNLCNVQRNTPVERLWRRGEFRPPWLWSATEALGRMRSEAPADRVVISDPLAAGSPRGPHNCGECDAGFAAAIRRYDLSQDPAEFGGLSCGCRDVWRTVLELEDHAFGAPLVEARVR